MVRYVFMVMFSRITLCAKCTTWAVCAALAVTDTDLRSARKPRIFFTL
jgi:hypothetical protein